MLGSLRLGVWAVLLLGCSSYNGTLIGTYAQDGGRPELGGLGQPPNVEYECINNYKACPNIFDPVSLTTGYICLDLQNDNDHCGDCSTRCFVGRCAAGQCQQDCPRDEGGINPTVKYIPNSGEFCSTNISNSCKSTVGTTLTLPSKCGCGCAIDCPAPGTRTFYYSTSALCDLNFTCGTGQIAFSNACGCGCMQLDSPCDQCTSSQICVEFYNKDCSVQKRECHDATACYPGICSANCTTNLCNGGSTTSAAYACEAPTACHPGLGKYTCYAN